MKSINNFMAEVKRECRAAQTEPQTVLAIAEPPQSVITTIYSNKLIKTCVKSLRTQVKVIKSHEESQVLATNTVDGLAVYWLDTVKHSIKLALQARKQGGYIKPKEMKAIEKAIIKHLNFMLPSLAYYVDLLGCKPIDVDAINDGLVEDYTL
ncbi:hypothetical protein [Vibrio cincinnatiensis]|uniref:hypothetical protein n=1 Tax=Vibrio cincinnatiensis TaxID=675 RepID=UPI001EDE296C|nr:hypothetical protein [Vibrio cincinnatiensis]MCG3728109.1 hypothetical protein [Vibrio cincinnatiensis]